MEPVYIYQWLLSNYEVRGYGITTSGVACIRIPNFKQIIYVECLVELQDVRTLFVRNGFKVYNTPNACNLYGATGKGTFFATRAPSYAAVRAIEEQHAAGTFRLHELRIAKPLEFTARCGLPSVGWVQVSGSCAVARPITMVDAEYVVPNWHCDLNAAPHLEGVPAATIVFFDIEVKSDYENAFPSDREDEVVFQIGVVACRGTQVISTDLLSLRGLDYDDTVHQYDTEAELLQAFVAYVRKHRAVAVCGYNIMGFDIPYMIKRCSRLSMLGTLRRMGWDNTRLAAERAAGMGHSKMTYIQWDGVLTIDLMPIVMMDHRLDSYSLNSVAGHFLKAAKDPIRPRDIFHAYETRRMARVGRYCVKDTMLCNELADYLNSWVALCEMAAVCNTGIMQLFTQGQQVRVFSQIYRHCTPMSVCDKVYVIPDGNKFDAGVVPAAQSSYTGAYVYEPVAGVYKNVVPMDFSSLYPSIIISKNICYTTLVDSGGEEYAWQEHQGCEHDPAHAQREALGSEIGALQCAIAALPRKATQERARLRERVAEMKVRHSSMAPASVKCNVFNYRFTREREGVLPRVLRNLLDSRADIRERMKGLSDVDMLGVMDKRQLAYKISANSVYGTMGTQRGYLPFMAGAMTTTYCGRKLIEKAAELLRTVVGATLVYGDTDSCYVQLGHERASLEELWQLATVASARVSTFFEHPVRLEFEQRIYTKFIIFTKKRYIYNASDAAGVQHTGGKGVMLSRRDNAVCARNVYAAVMDAILCDGPRSPVQIATDMMLQMMVPGALPDEHFVFTNSVQDIGDEGDDNAGAYKVRDPEKARAAAQSRSSDPDTYRVALRQERVKQMPAQAQLAERMRLEGRALVGGARVEYVVLMHRYGVPNSPLGSRILDYDRWSDMKAVYPLDRLHYMKSVINACDQLFVTAGYGHVCSKVYNVHMQAAYVRKELLQRKSAAI